jgi:HAD superfamily hydrolase (TIGR01490 family)
MDHQLLPHHLYDVKKRIALFDFDGTITTKDTLLEFIRFYHGTNKFLRGFAVTSPWIGLMTFKLIPNWRAKEKVLSWFFKGEDEKTFDEKCKAFSKSILPSLIRPKALAEIQNHKRENATVVVISASAENWVRPWCEENQLNCLATRLEVVNGKLTGRISGFNCYGAEKERRIRECYNLADFEEIFAYGDSKGDLEMLALAQKQHYKPFRV